MTRPEHPRQPLPDALQAWVRQQAIQKVNTRKGPLWSCRFPLPGMANDVILELLPSLELRVRSRSSGDVFMQTEPVSFGPLAPNSETLSQRFEQWCAERRGDTAPEDAEGAGSCDAEEGGAQ